MSQNGQTHFKNLAAFCCKNFKVYLTILGHYALKGEKQNKQTTANVHIYLVFARFELSSTSYSFVLTELELIC